MASRKEQKEALRKERLEREQREAQAAARKRLIGIVVAGVLVLGIVGALAAVLLAGGDDGGGGSAESTEIDFPDARDIPAQRDSGLAEAIPGSGCRAEARPLATDTAHRDGDIEYPTNPPHSGPQNGVPAEDDLYEESPSEERVLHSLEHGRIGVWVNPAAPEEVLAGIRSFYDEDPYHVIVTPQPGLKEQVALSAWEADGKGRILRCRSVTDESWDALRAFKEAYRDKGPEFAP